MRDKPCRVVDVRVEENARLDADRRGNEGIDRPGQPLRLKKDILDRELDRVYDAKTLKGVRWAGSVMGVGIYGV